MCNSFIQEVDAIEFHLLNFITEAEMRLHTVISILFVAKSDENAFQSRKKAFFWARF